MTNEELEAELRERFDWLPHRLYDIFSPNSLGEVVVGVRNGADIVDLWEFCQEWALSQECVIPRHSPAGDDFHSSYVFLVGTNKGTPDDFGF